MVKRRLIIASLCFIMIFSLTAQSNPFITTTEETGENTAVQEARGSSSLVRGSSFWTELTAGYQKILREKMTRAIRFLKEEGSAKTLIFLFGLSFLYGLIHALGPGHRKTVLAAYFFSRKSKPSSGIFAGLLMGLLHGGSAIAIIWSIYAILNRTLSSSFENVSHILELVSYGAIILMGIILLSVKIFRIFKKKEKEDSKLTSLPLILVSGMVPCPGASMILIFSISAGFFLAGILSALAMSLGMGTALALISFFTILMKRRATTLLDKTGNKSHRIMEVFEITALVLMILFGALMIPLYPV